MYCGYITKLKNVRPHPNADRLVLADVFDSTVVVGVNSKDGDVVIYFPCDGQLSQEYCDYNNLVRKKDENGNNIGGFLDPDKRNIKAIKLRGERSDGLVMPLSSLNYLGAKVVNSLSIGDQITVLDGQEICRKYIPRGKKNVVRAQTKRQKRKVNEFPLFEEHRDTEQLDYNIDRFKTGDLVTLTLKMHGTSGRTAYLPSAGKTKFQQFLYKFFPHYKYVTGTRRVVLQSFEDGGFYGDNAFRLKYHNLLKGKLLKGETIYYEIVGYVDDNTTIMGIADNKKMNDKEFIKKYGAKTTFSYGCEPGQNEMYVYRMTMTNPDGEIIEYPWSLVKHRCEIMGLNTVMDLDRFIYTTQEDMYERINKWLDIEDPIGKTHVSEGVVARLEDKSIFTAFKKKSFAFRVLEGIIKENADAPDMEESQEVTDE